MGRISKSEKSGEHDEVSAYSWESEEEVDRDH